MEEGQNSERRGMSFGDWCNSAVNLVIGVLLGLTAYGLMQLVTTGAWTLVIVILVGAAGVILLEFGIYRLFAWLLPSGIRAPTSHYPKARAPLIRLLGFPSGFLIGAIFAHFNLGNSLLEMLP